MTHRNRAIASLGVLVLVVGCGPSEQTGAGGSASHQVRAPLNWHLAIRELAFDDASPLARIYPKLFGVDNRGHLYVYDNFSGDIAVADTLGVEIFRIGGRGGGPGEFSFPTGLGVAPNGAVAVYDMAKLALIIFDSTHGSPVEVRLAGHHSGAPIRSVGGRWLVAEMALDRASKSLKRSLELVGLDGDVNVLMTFTEQVLRPTRLPGCPAPVLLPRLFERQAIWTGSASGVAVSTGQEYEVVVFGPRGTRIRSLRDDAVPQEVSPAQALAEIQLVPAAALALKQCRATPEELIKVAGVATHHPVIGNLAVSPDGSVWVKRADATGQNSLVDVYDADGKSLGVLPSEAPFPTAFVDDDTFVTVASDSAGAVTVVFVHITRK